MNKNSRLVYNKDGKTCVLSPAPEAFDPESRSRLDWAEKGLLASDASDKEIWDFIIAREKEVGNVPEDTVYSIVDKSEIPEDRAFRNALDFDHKAKKCSHNMNKAKELHKDTLRELRKPKLASLDVAFMQALEDGKSADMEVIAAKKKELRDVTKLAMPDSVEELKEFIPECLK